MIRCPVAQMPPPLVVINLDQECSWFRNRIKINCCYHYLCFCVLYLNLCWFNFEQGQKTFEQALPLVPILMLLSILEDLLLLSLS